MYLWGAAPLVAVAFMLSSPGLAAAPGQPATGPTLAMTSATLTQTGTKTWATTVLITDPGKACPQPTSFALQTSQPDQLLLAHNVVQVKSQSQLLSSKCLAARVFFTPMTQFPESATLELTVDGNSSSVSLTVGRTVNLIDYLLVPALVGAGMLVLLLSLVLCCVTTRDWDGSRMRGSLRPRRGRRFWQQSVLASGAWTANDSWATNISASVAILGSVFGITSAANSLFPGVALDRFALLLLIAGGIVTAVPIVFGICYARWTTQHPGLTPDSLIRPTVKLRTGCEAQLLEDARIAEGGRWWLGQRTRIDRGDVVSLPQDTQVIVTDGSPAQMTDSGAEAGLRPGTIFVAPSPGTIRANQPQTPQPPVKVTLGSGTQLIPGPSCWAWIRRRQRVTVSADPDGKAQHDGLKRGALITLPDGALARLNRTQVAGPGVSNREARLQAETTASRNGSPVTFLTGAKVRLRSPLPAEGDRQCTLDPADTAPTSGPQASTQLPVPVIRLPDGADLSLGGGAAIGPAAERYQWPVQVKDGGKIQVPADSTVEIYAATALALPGGSDVVVAGESAIKIICDSGLLPIAADNLAPAVKAAAKNGAHNGADSTPDPVDVALTFPVYAFAPGGVKITAAGSADVRLPAGMAVTAPRRKDFVLAESRHIVVPQASGTTLVANMGLVVITALVTIFGIGAQLGIAWILMGLSDATLTGKVFAWLAMAAVAVVTLIYSMTAIRALADPQPGSSLSATSGTSFTL